MRIVAFCLIVMLCGIGGCSTATGFINGARTAGSGLLEGAGQAGNGILLDAELAVQLAKEAATKEEE